MDCAGRVLLQGRKVAYVDRGLGVKLFEKDVVFRPHALSAKTILHLMRQKFDLIIIDSFSPKAMALKFLIAPTTEFVGLYGFFNAFETNRSIYSFRRLETLLGMQVPDTVRLSSGVVLDESKSHRAAFVVIGIGGEWGYRTYDKWDVVIRELMTLRIKVVLLGSDNGTAFASSLNKKFPQVINYVGKTDLRGALEVLRNAAVYVGADGGLWHLASTVMTPSVVLHANCHIYDSEGRLVAKAPDIPQQISLSGTENVSEVDPCAVVFEVARFLELDPYINPDRTRPRNLIRNRTS
jgi:hypothetical protein